VEITIKQKKDNPETNIEVGGLKISSVERQYQPEKWMSNSANERGLRAPKDGNQ